MAFGRILVSQIKVIVAIVWAGNVCILNPFSAKVTRGWNRGQLASFFRVRTLLSLLMVRHTKMDIEELPLPRYHTTVLSMSAEEVTTYNTLVCAVQSNLLITSMEGKTSGAQDSLLHKSQARHAKKALENVRLVCAGGTQVLPTLDQENWTEFIRDFELCNPVPQKLDSVKQYLSRAVTGQLSPCGCCGMMLSTLLVFPCGDLVCTECVDHETTSCIVCNARFDVDLFQRLQPGMVYNWLHNVEEELKGKKSKLKPEESDSQTNEEPAAVVLEGGAGILAPVDPSRPRRRTRKPGDGHACDYSPKDTNGECLLCWKQHDECDLTTKSRRCEVCYRSAEGCPTSETKSFYVVKKLIDLHKEHQRRDQSLVPTPLFGIPMDLKERRPLKVIVFSQFRKVLNMTGDRLLRRFGSGCIAEYWGSFRRKELHKFIHDANCFCMLLGKDGSEGLDLSFVTHM
jgi:SNF2 family DNA or RNA helicase